MHFLIEVRRIPAVTQSIVYVADPRRESDGFTTRDLNKAKMWKTAAGARRWNTEHGTDYIVRRTTSNEEAACFSHERIE